MLDFTSHSECPISLASQKWDMETHGSIPGFKIWNLTYRSITSPRWDLCTCVPAICVGWRAIGIIYQGQSRCKRPGHVFWLLIYWIEFMLGSRKSRYVYKNDLENCTKLRVWYIRYISLQFVLRISCDDQWSIVTVKCEPFTITCISGLNCKRKQLTNAYMYTVLDKSLQCRVGTCYLPKLLA